MRQAESGSVFLATSRLHAHFLALACEGVAPPAEFGGGEALHARQFGGESVTCTSAIGAMTVSHRQTFPNWRPLPGQLQAVKTASAAGLGALP